MYKDKSAAELALLIRQKKAKPSEICADFISRIEKMQPETNAFITFDKESVMKYAEDLDKQPVTPETSPVFGLPVAVGDNICTSDMPTTCASKMLVKFNALYDATAVARLKEQGAIIIGKTNLDEFNMGAGEKNAAAVASGCTPFILGSDIDGSLRIPAAYCGAVGYKPTYGAVSRYGLISYAGSFDQIGSITRTVSDAALLMSAVAGHDEMDATSNPQFTLGFFCIEEFGANNIKGKKIGIPKEYKINGDIQTAVETYKSLGAEPVDISLPLTEYALSVYHIISSAEASSNLAKFDGLRYGYRTANFNENDVDSLYINSRTEGFGEEVKRRIILGTYVLSSEHYEKYYKKARTVMAMIRREFKAAFEKCDMILAPVMPVKIEQSFDFDDVNPVSIYNTNIFTVLANIAGLPAVSIPIRCAEKKNGIPVSFQLIGKRFDDVNLLGFARVFERETGMSNANIAAEVK